MPLADLLEWAVEVKSHLRSSPSQATLVAAVAASEENDEGRWGNTGGMAAKLCDSIHELVVWTREQGSDAQRQHHWVPGAALQCFCCHQVGHFAHECEALCLAARDGGPGEGGGSMQQACGGGVWL